MLTFAYPWILVLLPLPWLLRSVLPARRDHRTAVRVPFGARIREADAGKATVLKRSVPRRSQWIAILIWLLLLAAMMRPQWIDPPITKTMPTRDLLLLVDLSSSMNEEDFTNAAGKQVDRLSAVKEVLGDFLEHRQGDRLGLVVFGDAPYLQAPFSTDLDLVRQLLDGCAIGMAGPRTALGDAIGLGVNLFDDSDAPAKTIIALTDGNDTKSQVPPVEAARVASQRGIRIHTVAIGDPTTAGEEKLDVQALRDVASTAGGSYFFAGDRAGLEEIYAELDRIETHEVKTVSHRPRRDLYFWLLAAVLVLSLIEKAWQLLKNRRSDVPAQQRTRVRVNALTGELEVV